jgi:branched-chain amino acid transport system permease protein
MRKSRGYWPQGIKIGLIGGGVGVLVALIGMVEAFGPRYIISDVVSMGHTLLLLVGLFVGYLTARRTTRDEPSRPIVQSLLAGLMVGGLLALLVVAGSLLNLRKVFINASPMLYKLLTVDLGMEGGIFFLLCAGPLSALLAALFYLSSPLTRRVLGTSLGCVGLAGVLQDLLRPTFALWGPLAIINDWLYAANGLTLRGAASLFILVALLTYFWAKKGSAIQTGFRSMRPARQRAARITAFLLLVLLLLVLPQVLGLFLSEVLTIVGLYVLLGLGLNIVVGYAGLLDLGYVAFFAIGAYTLALLTSPELGFFHLSFWGALPFAVFIRCSPGRPCPEDAGRLSRHCHSWLWGDHSNPGSL